MKKYYIYLSLAIVLYSLVSVLSKAAALQDFLSLWFLLFYGGELVLMAVYAVIWQICLEKVPLVSAYAMRGFLFVLIGIWSWLFFHETLSVVQWIGMLVIIAGVLISESDGKSGGESGGMPGGRSSGESGGLSGGRSGSRSNEDGGDRS